MIFHAAYGLLISKQSIEIVDIEAADIDNHLDAMEYVEDIYKFYKLVEIW